MAKSTDRLAVWAVDSLEKVTRDAEPVPAGDRIEVEACRNEFSSAQVAVRAIQPVRELRVSLSQPRHEQTGARGVELTARFVGYIPVENNTPDTPAEELSCTAPALVPDPLLADEVIGLEANTTQPVWLTVFVPRDAPPGKWAGAVEVQADGTAVEVPFHLTVFPVTLPRERHLLVTNWMNLGNFASFYGTQRHTPRFWQVVANFASNLAAHRHNVTWCPNDLIHITQEAEGKLSFDYSDYDRWVQIFDSAGCMDLIEGGHVGMRGDGKWENPWFDWRPLRVRSRDGAEVKVDPELAVKELVKSLIAHVHERGWFERFIMHVVDEPAPHTEESYKEKSRLIHELMPGVRFIEAMSLLDMRGYLDIWVPNLDHLDEHREHYLNLRDESGFDLWFYTCMYPTGRYPNRFLDHSLLKTRILHWINWRYHLTGYLHWGLNYWTEDPFKQAQLGTYPPGDAFIVYPGADGPLDSLRWEQMREGLQDFELLWLLDQRTKETGKDAGKADRICADLVPDPLTYARQPARLRAARRAIIDAILAG